MIMHHNYDCLVMINTIRKKYEAALAYDAGNERCSASHPESHALDLRKAAVFLTASIAKVTWHPPIRRCAEAPRRSFHPNFPSASLPPRGAAPALGGGEGGGMAARGR